MVHTIIPKICIGHFTKSPLEDQLHRYLLHVMAPTRYHNTPHFLQFVRSPTKPGKLTQHNDKLDCKKQRQSSDDMTVDDFTVKMDVRDFKTEEIDVKLLRDNVLSVEAKRETQDQHGYVFKQVIKKFTIPAGFDLDKMAAKLTTDGTLAVTVPRMVEERQTNDDDERNIPISRMSRED